MSVNRYNSTTGELEKIAGGTLYADAPIGSIQAYGGTTAPSGWLLCQGQAISRTEYAELFNAIGTAYGTGDGSTTFNIPDLREATTKGTGLSGKSENHYSENGVILGEFIEDRLQSHTHGIRNGFDGADPDSAERGDGRHGYSAKSNDASGRTGNTTEVKAIGVNYIIKAKQVAMPADIQSAIEEQNSYSTEETYTGKRWIDGKPIYRKVFYINNPVINWTGISLNFNDIDWIVKGEYIAKRTNGAVITEFYNHDSDNYEVHLLTENGALSYYCQCSSALSAMSITIEYTKTTD